MKKTTILGLASFVFVFAGCKKIHHPVDKNVYAIVKGFAGQDRIQSEIYLNLENEQTLVLFPGNTFQNTPDEPMYQYNVGDTVWFHYDEIAKKRGVVFAFNVIHKPSESMKKFLINQQKEIFHGKGR